MISFTTFIFTLLTHIARAMPACGGVASPGDLYDPMYDDAQLVLRVLDNYKITWDVTYDNPNGNTKSVTCSNLATKYPRISLTSHILAAHSTSE